MGTIKNTKGKRLNILWVIILIGSIPLLTAILILTTFATRKMEQELEDSTFARLKACAVSVNRYFEWDVQEGMLSRDDASYESIDSMKKDEIELTFFEGNVRYITSVVDENGKRAEGTKADAAIWKQIQSGNDYQADGVQIAGTDYYVYYTPVYSEKIRKSLAKTTAHIERIANGSISEDVEGASAIDEINTLIESSKILKEKLNDIVTNVNDHVVNLQQDTSSLNERTDFSNEGAGQISQAMEELSVTSIAEAIDQMNTATGHVSEVSDELAELMKYFE